MTLHAAEDEARLSTAAAVQPLVVAPEEPRSLAASAVVPRLLQVNRQVVKVVELSLAAAAKTRIPLLLIVAFGRFVVFD